MDADTTTKPIAREYLRVSRDQSGRERSNTEQQDENRRTWSEFEFNGEHYADAVSASRYSTKPRGGWQALISDLRADRFDADILVLWEASRGSRKVSEWCQLLELCEDHQVRIAVTEHHRTYDPINPRDRRTLLEDAVDSEYESAKTSGRIRRSNAASAAAGQPHGRVPYGYRHVHDDRTGRFLRREPEPDEAAVVVELFDRIIAGHSLRSIARDFADRGIDRRGKPFTGRHLRQIATSRYVIGQRVHVPGATSWERSKAGSDKSVAGDWEPIVKRETWDRTQRILSNPKRTTTRGSVPVHLLSLIARCDFCGEPMSARLRPNRLYQCHGAGCVRIDADELDELAIAVMLAYLSDPSRAERLTADDGRDRELDKVRAEITSIRVELDELADRVGRGELSASLAARSEPQILTRLHAAEARESELSTPDRLGELIEPGDDVARRWQAVTVSARREIARLLLTPELLGELRVKRSPSPGRKVPATERVVWRR